MFEGKKIMLGVCKLNFFSAILCWGFFLNNRRYSAQKKETFVKLIYFIKANLIISFFSKFLVKFLRNSIKYVDSRAVSGALLVALKVELLRVITVQSVFKDDS